MPNAYSCEQVEDPDQREPNHDYAREVDYSTDERRRDKSAEGEARVHQSKTLAGGLSGGKSID